MPPRRSPEFERIARIERELGRRAPRGLGLVERGIGDDAAVLGRQGRSVWTIDTQVAGVHFRSDWLSWEDVGYRAVQAAASDLAAMGARPVGALVSLTLPPAFSDRQLEQLTRGEAQAARDCDCPIVGGNLTRARVFSITTTLLGEASRPLLRAGAEIGDEVWLLGEVGQAALGLRALQRGRRASGALGVMIASWRRPRALLSEGLALRGRAHAALDVSDGLAGDAQHLARASRVQIRFDVERLAAGFSADYLAAARALRLDPVATALSGGEDYALLATGVAARRPKSARVIGSVARGSGVIAVRGAERVPLGHGFDHFATVR